MQEAVARAERAVADEDVGAVRIGDENREMVARADMIPARKHDLAVAQDGRIAIMALVERNLMDIAAVGVHHVQNRRALAVVFVEVGVGLGIPLREHFLAARLAVRGEHDAAIRQIGRIDIVTQVGDRVVGDETVHYPGRQIHLEDAPATVVRTAHRKQHALGVVRNFRIGDVALALRVARGEVHQRRTWRGEVRHHQIAARGKGQRRGRIPRNGVAALGEHQRKVAADHHRAAAVAAAAGKRSDR